ncbi:glycoside hydrolase superfamily [Sporodiniella umbellata]|nr:glycoside hydrolase superfamily [Sporodiniella umbellata]
MAPDIKYCQSKGKLVTLSLGGATGGAGFQSEQQALSFADTIWNMFLGGSSSTRPFGDAILDGIDLDIEGGGSNHYIAFLKKLNSYFPVDSKKYYITAAPQCVFPDSNLQATLNGYPFDAIYVQFYNNPCGLQYFNTNQWNFGVWDNWARTSSLNPNVKIYIGAPASSTAAGSGYVTAASLLEIALKTRDSFPSFGGIMFWDVSQAHGNNKFGHFLKKGLTLGSNCKGDFEYPFCTAPSYVNGQGYSGGSSARWYASSAPSNDPYSEWLPIQACSSEKPKIPKSSSLSKSISYIAPSTSNASRLPKASSSHMSQVFRSSASRSLAHPTATATAASAPPPAPKPKSPECENAKLWSSSAIYTGGNNAYYNGAIWKAKWWSQNDIPGGTMGVWEKVGACENEVLLSSQSILEGMGSKVYFLYL